MFVFQKGFNATQQREIDEFLIQEDGTDSKSKAFRFSICLLNHIYYLEKYGANAILGISIAVCKAGYIFLSLTWFN